MRKKKINPLIPQSKKPQSPKRRRNTAKCPLTAKEFEASKVVLAEGVDFNELPIIVNGETLLAPKRMFKTGSFGFFASCGVVVKLRTPSGKSALMRCQAIFTITVSGSGEDNDDESDA